MLYLLQVCSFSTLQVGAHTSFHRWKWADLKIADEPAAYASGLPPCYNIETEPTSLLPTLADCQRGRRETIC